jgi:hypothetical protein
LHIVGEIRPGEIGDWSPVRHGADAAVGSSFRPFFRGRRLTHRIRRRLLKPDRVDYRHGYLEYAQLHTSGEPSYPIVMPNFDNTPRSGRLGVVLLGTHPSLFEEQLRVAFRLAKSDQAPDPIVFLRSWNEWAEGNYVEPDQRWGRGYLEAVQRVCTEFAGV